MLCGSNTDMIALQLRKWCTLSLLFFSDSIQSVISFSERESDSLLQYLIYQSVFIPILSCLASRVELYLQGLRN